jgi:hypothetical protein
MGKKAKKEEKKFFSFRMPLIIYEKIRKDAIEERRSMCSKIIKIVEEYYKKKKEGENIK